MEGSSCSRDLENSSFLCYKGGELATKYYLGSRIRFRFDILYYGGTTAMQCKQKYKGKGDTFSTKFKMSKGIMQCIKTFDVFKTRSIKYVPSVYMFIYKSLKTFQNRIIHNRTFIR